MDKPQYPHITPGPTEPQWRPITLYSIAGWISSWYPQEIATAFGGYFRFDEQTLEIQGELVDIWGAATINGLLNGPVLVFQKLYHWRAAGQTMGRPINYRFENNGDRYVGGFDCNGTKGKAECMVLPVVANAFGVVAGPIG